MITPDYPLGRVKGCCLGCLLYGVEGEGVDG